MKLISSQFIYSVLIFIANYNKFVLTFNINFYIIFWFEKLSAYKLNYSNTLYNNISSEFIYETNLCFHIDMNLRF